MDLAFNLGDFDDVVAHETCKRCRKTTCLGPCPNCGAHVFHGVTHASECTIEQDQIDLAAAYSAGRLDEFLGLD